MATYYAARAPEYERVYQKPERQEDLRQLRDIVTNGFSGMDVLEVACGTGYWTTLFAQTAKSVLATDVNEEVLAIARGRMHESPKSAFLNADAYNLPEPNKTFTGGFCGFWWSHIPKYRLQPFLDRRAHV